MLSIPIAGYRDVYSLGHVEAALADETEADSPLLRKTYQKMQKVGATRFLIKPSNPGVLDELAVLCPNFESVISDLKKYLHLAVEGNESLSFVPLLLAGDPGVGKTHFAKKLAGALGMDFEFCSMSSMTAGFVLSGASATWRGARHGKVAQKLIEGATANPMFVLDELDKVRANSQHDPMGSLLQLLEKETSTHFKDEFLDIPVDASVILWVATANDLSQIPEPILSRMNVFEVPCPTVEQAAQISKLVYAVLLAEHKWNFEPELHSDVIGCLSDVPPREMKKRLLDAMGAALMAGRRVVTCTDVFVNRRGKKSTIGFIN